MDADKQAQNLDEALAQVDAIDKNTYQDLPPLQPEPPGFEDEYLPEALAPWARDCAERSGYPIDFLAVALMVAAATIVGRQVAIRPKAVDTWAVIANLWGLIVGRPGQMKTAALKDGFETVRKLEAAAREEYLEEKALFDSQKASEEAKDKAAKDAMGVALRSGDVDGAEKIGAERERDRRKPPVQGRYMSQDATQEALLELLAENPRGLCLFRDELYGWLEMQSRSGREGERQFFLEAWGGDAPFTTDRIVRGTTSVKQAALSVVGTIQPDRLNKLIASAGGSGGDGLLQRFQLMVYPRAYGTSSVDRQPDTAARDQAVCALEALDEIDPLAIRAEQADTPFLRFSTEAQPLFTEWLACHKAKLGDPDTPVMLEGHLAKFAKLVPALALLCHLIDGGRGPVGETALTRALAWAEYLEGHASAIYTAHVEAPLVAAHEIEARIQSGKLKPPFTTRELKRKQWAKLADGETVNAGLELLADTGRLRCLKLETNGRPSYEWHRPVGLQR